MRKSLLAIAAVFSFLIATSGGAISGPYPFGDEPYRLDWGTDPQIQSGCWKWNWQLYQWNDYCAVYMHPKAFMYPRGSRVVLRSKG
jgi:hypothetical protein